MCRSMAANYDCCNHQSRLIIQLCPWIDRQRTKAERMECALQLRLPAELRHLNNFCPDCTRRQNFDALPRMELGRGGIPAAKQARLERGEWKSRRRDE